MMDEYGQMSALPVAVEVHVSSQRMHGDCCMLENGCSSLSSRFVRDWERARDTLNMYGMNDPVSARLC